MSRQFPRVNSDPAVGATAITPDDNVDLPLTVRAIYIGSDGDLRVQLINGDPVTFTNLSAGTTLPIHIVRVFSTGTTCINLIGLE